MKAGIFGGGDQSDRLTVTNPSQTTQVLLIFHYLLVYPLHHLLHQNYLLSRLHLNLRQNLLRSGLTK